MLKNNIIEKSKETNILKQLTNKLPLVPTHTPQEESKINVNNGTKITKLNIQLYNI